jgi:hypothetical protein
MTKTSTSKPIVKLPNKNLLVQSSETELDLDIFYSQIKKDLDQLLKEPHEDTINNILNYSRQK